MDEIIDCVMCEKPAIVILAGKKLINAALCFDCANKIDRLIAHCELYDWVFEMGVNSENKLKIEASN